MKKLRVNVKILLLTEDIFGFNIKHSFFREIDFAMEELKISIKEYGRIN
jgi:hypothetical protein